MSEHANVNPLIQIQQAAAECGLTMQQESLPGVSPGRSLDGRGLAFDSAMEFFWKVVGDPANIKAFLEAIAGMVGAYFVSRASQSITIETGGIKVEMKGTNDYAKVVAAVTALQTSDKNAAGED